MQLLPGVAFPDDVKVACPPVKRIVVVRVHVGEPISKEHVRPVEEAVLKTVAPLSVSKVRVLGAPPLIRPHGAIAARLVLNQETPEHYRVRVPLSFAR